MEDKWQNLNANRFRMQWKPCCGSIPRPGQAIKVGAEARRNVPFSPEGQRSRDNLVKIFKKQSCACLFVWIFDVSHLRPEAKRARGAAALVVERLTFLQREHVLLLRRRRQWRRRTCILAACVPPHEADHERHQGEERRCAHGPDDPALGGEGTLLIGRTWRRGECQKNIKEWAKILKEVFFFFPRLEYHTRPE